MAVVGVWTFHNVEQSKTSSWRLLAFAQKRQGVSKVVELLILHPGDAPPPCGTDTLHAGVGLGLPRKSGSGSAGLPAKRAINFCDLLLIQRT